MRMARALAAVAASLLVSSPGTASAWTIYTSDDVVAGPVLAGDRAVWVESRDEGPLTVHVGSSGGADRVSYTAPGAAGQHRRVVALDATSSRVALAIVTGQDPGPRYSEEVLLGTPDGGFAPLETSDDHETCANAGLALQGDVLAETRVNCDGGEVVLRDLATGGLPRPVDWKPGRPYSGGTQAAGIKLAGRFAAWYMPPTFDDSTSKLVVYDLGAGREAYRLDLTYLLGSAITTGYTIGFDVQDDGTVAAAVLDSGSGQNAGKLLWASVADPRPHEIQAAPRAISLALHDGLVAFPRAFSGDWAVTDLNGSVRDVFRYDEPSFDSFPRQSGYGVAFDGTHLAWADRNDPALFMSAVHLESYPVHASPYVPLQAARVTAGKASVQLACPRSGPRCEGELSIVRRGRVLGRVPFALAHRRLRRVPVPLSRAARKALTRVRTLKVRAVVKIGARKSGATITLIRRR